MRCLPCYRQSVDFELNGEVIGSVEVSATPGCPCWTWLVQRTIADPQLLELAWNTAGPNVIRLVKREDQAFVQYAQVTVRRGSEAATACLVGNGCPNAGTCNDAEHPPLDRTATLDTTFVDYTEVEAWRFQKPDLARQVDLSALDDGEYRFCVAAGLDPPAQLVAVTAAGEVHRIGDDGTSDFHGTTPSLPTEVEVDRTSGEALASVRLSPVVLQGIDLFSGEVVSPTVPVLLPPLHLPLSGIEALDGGLLGMVGATDRSWFHWIDRETGGSTLLSQVLGWELYDLARDPHAGTVYTMGRHNMTPMALARVDPATGQVSAIGPLGTTLNTLTEGPDGFLYGLTPATANADLYRIDPFTAIASPVGASSLSDKAVALTLVGEPGALDCVQVTKQGEAVLAVNGSCGGPTARIDSPPTHECTSAAGTEVLLDGGASGDPNAAPGTTDSIVMYEWFLDFRTESQVDLGTGETLPVDLGLGTHEVTLRVTNTFGETDLETRLISVVDTTPPTLSIEPSVETLWPPDHTLWPITMQVGLSDACHSAGYRLTAVVSNEADDAPGSADGETIDDIQGVDAGTADDSFLLRAERSIVGDGRSYTTFYTAEDAVGNTSDVALVITVPLHPPRPVRIRLDQTAPGTVVHWDAVGGAQHYDVIRGLLLDLALAGAQVDLGEVTCIENASQDETTIGFEDPLDPAPGHPFFYLVSVNDGLERGFGTASSAHLRTSDGPACGP